jgi:hypothetical protein
MKPLEGHVRAASSDSVSNRVADDKRELKSRGRVPTFFYVAPDPDPDFRDGQQSAAKEMVPFEVKLKQEAQVLRQGKR